MQRKDLVLPATYLESTKKRTSGSRAGGNTYSTKRVASKLQGPHPNKKKKNNPKGSSSRLAQLLDRSKRDTSEVLCWTYSQKSYYASLYPQNNSNNKASTRKVAAGAKQAKSGSEKKEAWLASNASIC